MLNRFRPYTRKREISTIVNNKNLLINSSDTGSLENIVEPKKKNYSYNRNSPHTQNITNTDKIVSDFRTDIFQYSSRNIEKTITSFNSSTNQLFISGTIIDYGTESVSDKDFEIYYNGVRLPDIFMVKQINNDIVITLTEEYIQYDGLQLSEIKVIGKFI